MTDLRNALAPFHERHQELGVRVRQAHDELYKTHAEHYLKGHGPRETRFVYFATQLPDDYEVPSSLKVGMSVNPSRRIKALRTASPHLVLLRHTILSYDAPRLERKIQSALNLFGDRGEWFRDSWHTASLMHHRDAARGEWPGYISWGERTELGVSVASHYYNYAIDLEPDLKTPELSDLEAEYESAMRDTLDALVKHDVSLFKPFDPHS